MSNSLSAKEKIVESFLSLMKKQSFKSIKTVDIIKKSGVSHQTFYRTYCDKYQLAEEVAISLLKQYEGVFGKNSSWRDCSISILSIIQNNHEFFHNLVTDEAGSNIYMNTIFRLSKEATGQSSSMATAYIWLCTLREWDRNGFKASVNDTYHSLIRNLPASDILSGDELERAVNKYEQLDMNDFKTR